MDRFWLLTWTMYGTWLPGDPRGFVGPVRDESGQQEIHNVPGTPCDADVPALRRYAEGQLRGEPIYVDVEQATAMLAQFQETAGVRGWELLAVAIMANHAHVCLGVPGDPDPAKLLQSLKSYASRALNRHWPKPASDTWWTESGSRRRLKTEDAVIAAVCYVLRQERPLVVWVSERGAELARRGGYVGPLVPGRAEDSSPPAGERGTSVPR